MRVCVCWQNGTDMNELLSPDAVKSGTATTIIPGTGSVKPRSIPLDALFAIVVFVMNDPGGTGPLSKRIAAGSGNEPLRLNGVGHEPSDAALYALPATSTRAA